MRKTKPLALALAGAALLSACGGEKEAGNTPTSATSASSSSTSASAVTTSAPSPSTTTTTTTSSPAKTTATAKATAKPSALNAATTCSPLHGTSVKQPSFTVKSVRAEVKPSESVYTFTFTKKYSGDLFSAEGKRVKATEYGFRLVNGLGSNLIYSAKSAKAFTLSTSGSQAGQQVEVPGAKVSQVGDTLVARVPQSAFPMDGKAWGAEVFFYVGESDIYLSSCEKRG